MKIRVMLVLAVALCVLVQPARIQAKQTSEAAELRKRLDDLEARQRTMENQLDAIIAALMQARGDNVEGIELSIADAPVLGAATAKLVFVEFSDFQCPFCGRYVREAYGPLVKEFVDSGRVKYVFRHFPLETIHPQALIAAEAGECANSQGRFWEMHDQLFANQGSLVSASLVKYAQAVGLDLTKFQACMTNPATVTRVRADVSQAAKLGANSTPSFYIGEMLPNGNVKLMKKMAGSLPYAEFQAALNGILGSK